MNANRNLVIDFRINNKHDHYIGKNKHKQPHNKNSERHGNAAKRSLKNLFKRLRKK